MTITAKAAQKPGYYLPKFQFSARSTVGPAADYGKIKVRVLGGKPIFFCPIAQRQSNGLIPRKSQIGARSRFESWWDNQVWKVAGNGA